MSSRNGRSPTPPRPSAHVDATSGLVERDLRRGGDKGKIRAPRADFKKADADTRVRPDRKPDRADALALAERGHHRLDEEIICRHRFRAVRGRNHDLGAERHRDQRNFGRRIGIGDRAADGAAVAGRRMPDPRQHPRQHRHRGPDHGIALGLRLPCGGADDDGVPPPRESRQAPANARCRSASPDAPAASPASAPGFVRPRSPAPPRRLREARRPPRAKPAGHIRKARVSCYR